MSSGDLITRNYTNFRGVDFSDNEVNLMRSPDSINMWKNYKNNLGKCIETRPDLELLKTFSNTVFGLFFYKVGNTERMIVHCGTQLLEVVGDTQKVLYEGMNPKRSQSFIYNNVLYIKDGINYLEYDGEICQEVVGYIPTTSISRKPSSGGVVFEDVNMLTSFRKNTFVADGTSTRYYLDAKELDSDYKPIVMVNDKQVTEFSVDYVGDMYGAYIDFTTAPEEPLTVGQDNVTITFKKTVSGHRDRINKCTLLQVFDNRVFFSGNQNYPNTVFHSSLDNPRYCSDLDFYNEGLDNAQVKGMVAGNNALWVFKEPSQANTTIYYHTPVIDSEYGKIYPNSHSSISTGCIGGAINFNDDIVFFSDRGMEAIGGDVTTEQVLAHRSSLVDNKLLNEIGYKNMILEEWEGYLLVIIGNKVYLADSKAMFTNENHNEYEWFYWELDKNITSTQVKDGVLYLCSEDGVYRMESPKEYTSVTFTEEDGQYVLYGESTQNGTPTPDSPVEIVNTYKAGNYITTINGTTYKFTLDDDLRSVGTTRDEVYLDENGLHLIKSVKPIELNEKSTLSITTSYFSYKPTDIQPSSVAISNYFPYGRSGEGAIWVGTGALAINFWGEIDTLEEFEAWLTNNNTTVYYQLAETVTTDLNYKVSPLSYWTTPKDEFNYPQYQKTTNKRGCVVDMEGNEVSVYTQIDNKGFNLINTYSTNGKDYVVCRIKEKKWKSIQLKFSSTKPFKLYSSTLESYVGSYVKR